MAGLVGPCLDDVSDAERKLAKAITTAFDATAPLRSIALSSRRKPCVNTEIRSLMHISDRAYRIAHSSDSAADLLHFRTARANVSNTLDSAKNRYIASRLEEATSPEAKWRELRRLRVTSSTTWPTILPPTGD